MDPFRQPPRKFEIMGLCQPVYIEYSDNFIAITDLYIRYYGLCTPYNIEYSDLIAKFDFLGLILNNMGTSVNHIFDIRWQEISLTSNIQAW
jgi:hypothetical protein